MLLFFVPFLLCFVLLVFIFVTNINYLFDKSLIFSLFMYQSNEMGLPALKQPSVIFSLSHGMLGDILIRTMRINILLFVIQL